MGYVTMNGQNAPSGFTTTGSGPGTTTGATTTGGTTGTTTGTTTGGSTVSGFTHCDFVSTHKFYIVDIGHFGLCQSTTDETSFLFKPSMTSTSIRTCLIPTYKDASGSSTYIGQPQCTYTTAETVIQGRLYKNRTGFESYTLNGVMVMREPLLTSYYGCMNAYTQFASSSCPYGARTSPYCDSAAKNYMGQVCNSFISQYGGGKAYLDVSIR